MGRAPFLLRSCFVFVAVARTTPSLGRLRPVDRTFNHAAFNYLYTRTIMRTWARRARCFSGCRSKDSKRSILRDLNMWTFSRYGRHCEYLNVERYEWNFLVWCYKVILRGTREKRSAHACLPCFRRRSGAYLPLKLYAITKQTRFRPRN